MPASSATPIARSDWRSALSSRRERGQAMTTFAVGQAKITRIEETYQPVYRPGEIFPEWNDEVFAQHKHWLAPSHYEPASDLIKLSGHSWLLQIGKQKILNEAGLWNPQY